MQLNPYYNHPEQGSSNIRQASDNRSNVYHNYNEPEYIPQQVYRDPQAQLQYPYVNSMNSVAKKQSQFPPQFQSQPQRQNKSSFLVDAPSILGNVLQSLFNSDIEYCGICHTTTQNYVTYRTGCLNYVMCILLFFLTLCCFWVAFYVNRWKDAEFRCKVCNSVKYVRKGNCT